MEPLRDRSHSWAALFQKLAGPLMIFAAAAREGQEQAARYAGQIQQAEERLRQILKTQLPGKTGCVSSRSEKRTGDSRGVSSVTAYKAGAVI
ncbi:MAG: hypothetical protein V8S12_00210 [Lachnospiraceae bacterium]